MSFFDIFLPMWDFFIIAELTTPQNRIESIGWVKTVSYTFIQRMSAMEAGSSSRSENQGQKADAKKMKLRQKIVYEDANQCTWYIQNNICCGPFFLTDIIAQPECFSPHANPEDETLSESRPWIAT